MNLEMENNPSEVIQLEPLRQRGQRRSRRGQEFNATEVQSSSSNLKSFSCCVCCSISSLGLLATGIFVELRSQSESNVIWGVGASFIFFGIIGVIFGIIGSLYAKRSYSEAEKSRKKLKAKSNTSNDLANFVAEVTPSVTSPKEERGDLQTSPSASANSIQSERIKRSQQMRKVDMDTFLEFVQPETHEPPRSLPYNPTKHVPYADETTTNSSDAEQPFTRE